MAAESAGLADG